MYLLYLSQDNQLEKTVFLGAGDDPATLYQNALHLQTAEAKHKSLILKWLTRAEANLSVIEQRGMDHTFMHTPFVEGCYSIEGMTLHMKQIRCVQ
jgi:hypothetical protein